MAKMSHVHAGCFCNNIFAHTNRVSEQLCLQGLHSLDNSLVFDPQVCSGLLEPSLVTLSHGLQLSLTVFFSFKQKLQRGREKGGEGAFITNFMCYSNKCHGNIVRYQLGNEMVMMSTEVEKQT